jgi:hypothetical protein
MAWGDRAAEQYEKDQPSEYTFGDLRRPEYDLEEAQGIVDRFREQYPTLAEIVLDDAERRGD